jgi:hypothetical protein
MKQKQAHVGRIESQLKQWGAKLDELAAKAGEAGTEIKADYRQHLVELKAKHAVVQAKLAALKTASAAEWESFKAGVDSAGNELEAAFARVTG